MLEMIVCALQNIYENCGERFHFFSRISSFETFLEPLFGKGALTWPKLLTLLNDSFTSFFRC